MSLRADASGTTGTSTDAGGTGRFADASLTASAAVDGTRLSVEGVIATSFFKATIVGRLSYR